MFDYQGFSEEKIVALCDARRTFRGFYRRRYLSCEVYSFGRYLREYGSYPPDRPLFVYFQHSVNYRPMVEEHEINNDAEAMLVYNREKEKRYRLAADKPCYLITAPHVWYRRHHQIVQSPEARGTLVFPAHGLKNVNAVFNVEKYIEQLKALPREFHPICVSMHEADIKKGRHLDYVRHGLPVYTAGNMADVFFGDRLYEILRHFKYTMSNIVGSYTYYSVEMGLPFSLWGEGVTKAPDPNSGVRFDAKALARIAGEYETEPYLQEAALFSGIHEQIRPEQREFVEFVMGVNDGLSPEKLALVLEETYRRRARPFQERMETWRLKLKVGLKRLKYGSSYGTIGL